MKLSDIRKDGNYYSAWKALHQSDGIQAIKDGVMIAPKDIQVDLEAFCPHSCEFCSYRNVNWQDHGMDFDEPGKRVAGETGLPKELALQLPQQMHEAGIPSIELTGGGEPMVYPYISEFLQELGKYPIELAIVTNGGSLNENLRSQLKNLKWIRFSADAITAKTHSQVHRVPESVFDVVQKNIKGVVSKQFQDCKVGISFVITEHNYHEIEGAAAFYKDLGVDNIRYTFTYDPEGKGALSPEIIRHAERAMNNARALQDEDFKVFGTMRRLEFYSQPNTDFHFCGYQFFTWAIGYDGVVYPCCIMKYHKGYAMGDLRTESLKEIVNSDRRQRFIESFDVEDCKSCWLRDKNQFVEYLLTDSPQHVNFV
ncbi:MAG: radical SAM protein [Chloroflexi bacterium]|nr:radical SAM protein [Chloroflexota bacterium]